MFMNKPMTRYWARKSNARGKGKAAVCDSSFLPSLRLGPLRQNPIRSEAGLVIINIGVDGHCQGPGPVPNQCSP